MKVAIIGSGIYGVYSAIKLARNYSRNLEIDIYEKKDRLLSVAIANNQSRLHYGFHYPRSPNTIKQSLEGSKIFEEEFKSIIIEPKKNIYAIHKDSLTNFDEYIRILKEFKLEFSIENIINYNYFKKPIDIEGIINTKEKIIYLDKLIDLLKENLKLPNINIFLNSNVINIDSDKGYIELENNKPNNKNYDFIVNASYTNPNLSLPSNKSFKIKYELTGLAIVSSILDRVGVTIMDGNFVSLYPKDPYSYTLSSVIKTKILNFFNYDDFSNFYKNKLKELNHNEIINEILEDSKLYLNDSIKIKNKNKLWIAPKVKLIDDIDATRAFKLINHKKIISILCGKIDAVPIMFNELNKFLK